MRVASQQTASASKLAGEPSREQATDNDVVAQFGCGKTIGHTAQRIRQIICPEDGSADAGFVKDHANDDSYVYLFARMSFAEDQCLDAEKRSEEERQRSRSSSGPEAWIRTDIFSDPVPPTCIFLVTSSRYSPFRVLMVATSYPADLGDWRGLFIRHLADALARRVDVKLRLWSPPGEFPANALDVTNQTESRWLAGLMAAGGIAYLMRTGGIRGLVAPLRLLRILRDLYRREAVIDVYHINWLQNTLVLPRNGRPLLTTVLGTDMQLLKLPGMTSLLRRVLRHRRAVICPNAEWMVPELQRRFGNLAAVRFVPFGIEPRWFELKRQPEAPAKWLCVSRLTRGKIGTLFDWCESFFSSGMRELHLFGPMQQNMPVPEWVHYHGPATPESLCTEWFPNASGLITLSQHAEGRPQVMLEAMASGLPIIASRIPAHEDLLQHRQTGWLCGNADEVRIALDELDQPPQNRELGLRAQAWVSANIGTWDACAERYAGVYKELLSTCP